MDQKHEYHDPDYPEASTSIKQEPASVSEEEKLEKIKQIIRREFGNELQVRENEVMFIDQRMVHSRRMLHRLRYTLVNNYYNEQRLQLAPSQIQDEVAAQTEPRATAEVSTLLRDSQRRLHPSVRKLLGKRTADLEEILFKHRTPRNKVRKDYSAMIQCRNYTIAADTTKSLRPDGTESGAEVARPKKVPRTMRPKISNVVTLDQATRNQTKYRYRIIIGNTSKYAPAASRCDRSTHKWLLYVRGASEASGSSGAAGASGAGKASDITRIVTAVTVRLHHSYAPHHTVHIDKPPFHLSRRGWGEFPAKVELHFALPERNRPATVEHTIKLDRHYTGLQTLGAETVVDVWLYSTPEMIECEFKEDVQESVEIKTEPAVPIKTEPIEEPDENEYSTQLNHLPNEENNDIMGLSNDFNTGQDSQENWLDFFTNTTELDVDEMIIKPTKKIEEKNDIESLIGVNVINKDETEDKVVTGEVANVATVEKTDHVDKEKDFWMKTSVKVEKEELPTKLLSQTVPKKRIMKYMDPTTGKIYYLEMDRALDLSKVQEIVINSKGNVKTAKISPTKSNGLKNVRKNTKKGGVSLLKPEVQNQLKKEDTTVIQKVEKQKNSFNHIQNDHCYIASPWSKESKENIVNGVASVKKEKSLYMCLCESVGKLSGVRTVVNYLLRKIPIVCSEARDPDYVKCFPFVVETEEKYWKLDFAKRRNVEWSRAKLINKMLTEHFTNHTETIWRTKQILIFSRLHGYFPIRSETIDKVNNQTEWSMWTDMNDRKYESNIKQYYSSITHINSLTKFETEIFENDLSKTIELESDEEIDIVKEDSPGRVKKEVLPDSIADLTVLPVENEEDRLRFLFVEKKCLDIGIELRNEDVGSGFSYSAVHAVILSAVCNFAEELVRSSLSIALQDTVDQSTLPPTWIGSPSSRRCVSLAHVYRAARAGRLSSLSNACAGADRKTPCYL